MAMTLHRQIMMDLIGCLQMGLVVASGWWLWWWWWWWWWYCYYGDADNIIANDNNNNNNNDNTCDAMHCCEDIGCKGCNHHTHWEGVGVN